MTDPYHVIHHPMPPVYRSDARVLILGSMPGVASLGALEYYAHARNQFWDIMGSLVGAGRDLTYEERLERLRKNGIALWDVIASCERAGSLDSAIRSESIKPNPVQGLIVCCPNIRTLCFNGKAAERYFKAYIIKINPQAFKGMRLISLPSTSPAHAGITLGEKVTSWRTISRDLDA